MIGDYGLNYVYAIQRTVRAGQASGRALFEALASAEGREETKRATAAVLARIRLRHRGVMGGMVRRLLAASEHADSQKAARRVGELKRSCDL